MVHRKVSFETFQDEKVIPNLDGLRGMSILLVMLHHIPYLEWAPLVHLQQNGRFGVMLFFVISGFLITHLGLKERRETHAFGFKNFYVRRSLRIFPLYYAMMAFICVLVYVLNVYPHSVKAEFTQKLPSYLFYYSNLTGPIGGPYSLLWSLAVEEQFYLFFAVAFYSLSVSASQTLFFTLAVLRLTMPFWGAYFDDDHLLLVAFRYQEAILFGVSLAYLFEHPGIYRLFSKYAASVWGTMFVWAGLCVCFFGFSVDEHPLLGTVINVLFMLLVGITSIVLPLPGLGGPLLSHIGKISYGIYLMHTIVFYGIKKYISADPGVVFWVGGALTIGAATLSYRYFESYFLKLKKNFTVRQN